MYKVVKKGNGTHCWRTVRQAVQTRRVGTPQLRLQYSPRSAGLPSLYEPLNHNFPRQGHGPEVFHVKNHQDVFHAVAVITQIYFLAVKNRGNALINIYILIVTKAFYSTSIELFVC